MGAQKTTAWRISIVLSVSVTISVAMHGCVDAGYGPTGQTPDKHDEMGDLTYSQGRRPNLILIVSDDQGYADLYANLPNDLRQKPKYKRVKLATPTLDRLARSGVLFTDAHTNGNTCAPSRAGLILGRYPQRTGFWHTPDSRVGLHLDEQTLADVLKEGGYTTGMFGKWHLGLAPMYNPRQRGFDHFYGFLGHGAHDYYDLSLEDPMDHNNMMRGLEPIDDGSNEYLTDRIAEEAAGFIERNAGSPFFAYVCFNAVHSPLQAPKSGRFSTNSSEPRDQMIGMLGRMDLGIKTILDKVDDLGLRRKTLVVFLSDNGGARNTQADNAPLKGYKHSMWEGGIRVPFMISWPGTLAAGERFDEMIMGFDIFPTLISAAGLSMPHDKVYDGVDLLPFLRRTDGSAPKQGRVHKSLFWDQNQEGEWAARVGRWKLVKMGAAVELYDMTKDPGESNNVASRHPDKVEEIKAAYRAWRYEMKRQYDTGLGCRDPRYEEYSPTPLRHRGRSCKTLRTNVGCRDPDASNFDLAVTEHRDTLCEY